MNTKAGSKAAKANSNSGSGLNGFEPNLNSIERENKDVLHGMHVIKAIHYHHKRKIETEPVSKHLVPMFSSNLPENLVTLILYVPLNHPIC